MRVERLERGVADEEENRAALRERQQRRAHAPSFLKLHDAEGPDILRIPFPPPTTLRLPRPLAVKIRALLLALAAELALANNPRRTENAMPRTIVEKGSAMKKHLVEAQRLLTSSRDSRRALSVRAVALRLGFSSPEYFATVFKKYTGKSPLPLVLTGMPVKPHRSTKIFHRVKRALSACSQPHEYCSLL